ncbi:MAG: hypothetical protein U0840_04000 [Gemmataceae bacterium]
MARSLLERQISRVRHQLFLATLIHTLFLGWLASLLLAMAWVLVQPYLLPDVTRAVRGLVAGGLFAGGTLAGLLLALRRAPSSLVAALALDERFHLHERATTAQGLTAEQADTPAGQALLADVEARLVGLPIRERFPIPFPRVSGSLLPVALAGLVLLLLFWEPTLRGSRAGADDADQPPEVAADLDQKMKQLEAKPQAKKPAEAEPVRPEDAERIQQEIDKFTRAPRGTREEIRDRIKDATALEEQIRREQREQAQRAEAFREALQQVERLRRKNREARKDGDRGKAADALARGDLGQVQDELQRLSRRLQREEEQERLRRKQRDPKASDEERQQAQEELDRLEREEQLTQKERDALAKQLEQMEDDLKQLTRKKDEKQQQLRDLAEQGALDQEQLEREQEQLARDDEQLEAEKKEVEELARELGECKQCLKKGENGQAGEKLAKAAKQAGKLGQGGQEKALGQKLAQVQQVKQALCRAVGGAGVGEGRRPETKDDATAHQDAVVPAEPSGGKQQVIGQGAMGGFKGARRPAEMQEEIRQAAQEAPAAVDRQRLPASARKMTRDYFEKVRGQK